MKPRKAFILLILVLVTAALLGLVGVQLFFLNQSYDLKRQTFHQNVEKVLASIVAKLETQETLTRVSRLTLEIWKEGETEIARLNVRDKDAIKAPPGPIPNKSSRFYTPVEPRGETVILHLRRDQRVRLIDLAEEGDMGFRLPSRPTRKDDLTKGALLFDAVKSAGTHVLSLPNIRSTPSRYYRLLLDDVSHGITAKNGRVESVIFIPTLDQARTAIVDKVLEQHLAYEQIPILERIDTPTLDNTIRETLAESGIGLDYAFGILSGAGSSLILASPEPMKEELARSPMRTRLFPHDVQVGQDDLVLFFPSEKGEMMKQMKLPAALSLLFILITSGCFIAVVGSLFAQKRFSRLLTDFVNNMTHEFKTPLSTITLAGETLTSAEVPPDRDRVARYGRIIQEESRRMRHQVDKALEMAMLERKDLGLSIEILNVQTLVRKAVEPFLPEIEKRSGRIEISAATDVPDIEGDEVHLLSVLHNLIDNALKYTFRTPEIRIRAARVKRGTTISVEDNGIGLRPADIKHVFDKYYRVAGGNVQDVKGFGLGLSYVKRIVHAHGGTIRVRSEAGQGSAFEIELPCRVKSSRLR
jgi:two-component system phosphate regulon sensor histidine kinase PhoR